MNGPLKFASALAAAAFAGFIGMLFHPWAGKIAFLVVFLMVLWDCYKHDLDLWTQKQQRAYVFAGLILSVFVGFIVGGAVAVATGAWWMGGISGVAMLCCSLDICFRGRN